MPTLSNEEFAILTTRDLVDAMKKLKRSKNLKIKSAHIEKLLELAKIFNEALPVDKQTTLPEIDYCTPPRVKPTTKSPRVEPILTPVRNTKLNKLNKPTALLQPTSPTTVLQTPITHKKAYTY